MTEVSTEELDRVEELVRYVADHDGRLPTDDLPLAWWLVDALALEQDHPVRQLLSGIPIKVVKGVGVNLFPKKAHSWSVWLNRRNQLIWADRQGKTLDDILAKDQVLRTWVNSLLSQHHLGTLGPVETMLLGRTPLWDFERELNTKSAQKQLIFKNGIAAVRKFHEQHGHTDIPEGHTVAGLDVHQWWHRERDLYSRPDSGMKEHLRQQFARLGKLGVDLRTDKERGAADPAFRYRERLAQLADYIARNGMSALPERGEPFVNIARTWIAQYNNDNLDPALAAALEEIDGWSWGECTDLEVFREFALQYGHLDMLRSYVTDDGVPAGEELYRTRADRWDFPHPTSATRRINKQLDAMSCDGWARGTAKLAAWCKQYAWMPEPDCVTRSGFHLGAFMRQVYRKADHALLTRAQLKSLAEATGNPGWLESDADAYDRTETVLARFARSSGHCAPDWDSRWGEGDEERDLARFIMRVCADREADDLSPLKVIRLEDLPGWSWSRRDRIRGRGRAASVPNSLKRTREPVRSVRTDVADPDSKLNRSGLRQFLPGD